MEIQIEAHVSDHGSKCCVKSLFFCFFPIKTQFPYVCPKHPDMHGLHWVSNTALSGSLEEILFEFIVYVISHRGFWWHQVKPCHTNLLYRV